MDSFYRVSCVSFSSRVGDVKYNCDQIIKMWKKKDTSKVSLVVFPELCICGYTCEDMLFQEDFIARIYDGLKEIIDQSKKFDSIAVIGCPILFESKLYDCAVVIQGGTILGVVPKTYISNCFEAYERRWFAPGAGICDKSVRILDQDINFGTDLIFKKDEYFCFGVELAGDLRNLIPPSSYQALAGATVLVNLSASSELLSKTQGRSLLVNSQAKRCNALYMYVSSGSGESGKDYLYLGDAIISDMGVEVARTKMRDVQNSQDGLSVDYDVDLKKVYFSRLKESLHSDNKIPQYRIVPVKAESLSKDEINLNLSKTPFISSDTITQFEEAKLFLTSALYQRMKAARASKFIIGLSGGADSTFVMLMVVETCRRFGIPLTDIIAISMPGLGTSGRTKNNSKLLAQLLGTSFCEIDISSSMEDYFKDINLKDKNNVAYENSQARRRSSLLFDIANKEGGINLGTGDLSEIFLGWCTYAGDQMSSYNINASLPKTLIKHFISMFAEYDYKDNSEVVSVLKDIVDTPISPELRPGQNTEELVAPYELVDFFMYYFLKWGYGFEKLVCLTDKVFNQDEKKYPIKYIEETFRMILKRYYQNQFKRSPSVDGVCITGISLSSRRGIGVPSDLVNIDI